MAMIGQSSSMISGISPSVSQSAAAARLGDLPDAAFHVTLTWRVLLIGIFLLLLGLGSMVGGVAIYVVSPDSFGIGALIVLALLGLLFVAGACYFFCTES